MEVVGTEPTLRQCITSFPQRPTQLAGHLGIPRIAVRYAVLTTGKLQMSRDWRRPAALRSPKQHRSPNQGTQSPPSSRQC